MTDEELDLIRQQVKARVFWTDPERTARHYASYCEDLLAEVDQLKRELATAKAGWSPADDLG